MGFNCAIYIEEVARREYQPFLEGLERDGVLDAVRSISFTDDEPVCIVEYDGAEFLARYGEFPLDDAAVERLWLLFEFGDGTTDDRICDLAEFRRLSSKLPKLEALRADIESVTGHGTGGGVYGREGAYSPWGTDSVPVER